MPGANYMGGKRNAAKARLKDVTGRAQKGHFVKQRHQILVRGLQGDDGGFVSKAKGKAEDIDLAHAKRDLQQPRAPNAKYRAAIFKERALNSLVPTTSSSDYEPNLRSSKVLETLDVDDPYSLRETMDRLLNVPDFAGLSTSLKRRAPDAVPENQPIKKQKFKTATPSPLPPSSPQMSTSASNSSHISRQRQVTEKRGDRDSSSMHQLPIAEDDSDFPEDDSEDYRDEIQSSSEKHSPRDDAGVREVVSSFSELRGSSLPAFHRSSLVEQPSFNEDEDVSDLQLTPLSELPTRESIHLSFPSGSGYQEFEQESLSQSQQDASQDSFTLVLDFPVPERAYSHPSEEPEVEYIQDTVTLGDRPVPRNQFTLLDADQPWLALDELLGLNLMSTIKNDADPFQFLTDIGRRGLGYESPQKPAPSEHGQSSSSVMEIDIQGAPRHPPDLTQGSTKQRTNTFRSQYRPSLRSFVTKIHPQAENNLLAISSSPSSKATSTSGSASLLKTPSTDKSTSRFASTLAAEMPERVPNLTNNAWADVSMSPSIGEPLAPSTEITVSESLYQMLLNNTNTKMLEHKQVHPPSIAQRSESHQPMDLDTMKVNANSTLQSTIQGPSLFADDDDDY